MPKQPRFRSLLGLCLVLCAAAAMADPAPKDTPAPAAAQPQAASGLVAVTDPATGALIEATAADLAAMAAADPLPVRDDAALNVSIQTDGTRSAVLDDSYLSTTVVRVGPDGKLIFGCVGSQQEYEAFFAEKAAPATLEVR